MIEQGDLVVYRNRGMYRVERIGKLDFGGVDKKKDYLTLKSLENPKETVYIPAEETHVRKPIPREQAKELMDELDHVEMIWVPNERLREQEYKKCMASGDCGEWMRILKTLYQRGKKRGSMTSMDKKYQDMAERALFSEFSFVLQIPEKDMKNYFKDHVGTVSEG